MIVDTSAIVAVLLNEPERQVFLSTISAAEVASMSAGSWIELGAVTGRRRLAALSAYRLEAARRDLNLVIAPVTPEQAMIGHDAYRRYGIGSGHRARLNFGDCFAYALAKATGEPLLFKGDDFIHTDIRPALPLAAPPALPPMA